MNLNEKHKNLSVKKGKAMAASPLAMMAAIRKKEGKEGYRSLLKKLDEFEIEANYSSLRSTDWMKESDSVFTLLTAKEIFNWSEKDIYEIGKEMGKGSFHARIFSRFFVSIEKLLQIAPEFWRKYYDFPTRVEVVKHDKEKGLAIIRICGYDFDPITCVRNAGYAHYLTEICSGSKSVKVKETACVHKGDDYHEYLISWK